MAAIFRGKQRKNTKNSQILAKNTKLLSSNVVLYAIYMESYISEINVFFKNLKKKQDGRHISVQKGKYKGKCYKK